MRKRRPFLRLHILGFILAFAISTVVAALSQELPTRTVSTQWLEANLTQENLRIIDIRGSVKDYWQGHIPGAVYLGLDAVRWPDGGVPVKLLPAEAFAMMLGKIGVSEKTTVIVYAEKSSYRAPYLIWALDYVGHPSSALLEGGFDRWKEEERPITQNYPEIDPVKYRLSAKLNEEVKASLEQVKEALASGETVLIDVRSKGMYTGEKGSWKRKGHIKGAINRPWSEDLEDDGNWKNKEDLTKAYEKLGVTPDKTIIVSCGQGLTAAHTYFTLKHILGYPRVKNYDGSFSEWSNINELPVETGSK